MHHSKREEDAVGPILQYIQELVDFSLYAPRPSPQRREELDFARVAHISTEGLTFYKIEMGFCLPVDLDNLKDDLHDLPVHDLDQL